MKDIGFPCDLESGTCTASYQLSCFKIEPGTSLEQRIWWSLLRSRFRILAAFGILWSISWSAALILYQQEPFTLKCWYGFAVFCYQKSKQEQESCLKWWKRWRSLKTISWSKALEILRYDNNYIYANSLLFWILLCWFFGNRNFNFFLSGESFRINSYNPMKIQTNFHFNLFFSTIFRFFTWNVSLTICHGKL